MTLTAGLINRLKVAFLLTSSYLVIQIVGSQLTGSLALLADVGHILTDAGGLGLALMAINFSHKPPSPQRTYGFYRTEILAALANSVLLILISVYVLIEAYRRILQPPEVASVAMGLVATVGLMINLVSLQMLRGQRHSSLNIQAAYLEILSDTLGSGGVAATAILISITRFYLADVLVSIALALFILPRTWFLVKRSISILMEGTPADISYEEVKRTILGVNGVTGVFDLHIWTITSGLHSLSAHVAIIDTSRSQKILNDISSLLEKKFKIAHATIQLETYHPGTQKV